MTNKCYLFSLFYFYMNSFQNLTRSIRIRECNILEKKGFLDSLEDFIPKILFWINIKQGKSFLVIGHVFYEISIDVEYIHYWSIYTSYNYKEEDELTYAYPTKSCLVCSYWKYKNFYDKLESFWCWFCNGPSIVYNKLLMNSFIVNVFYDFKLVIFSCKKFYNSYIYESITDAMKCIVPEVIGIALFPREFWSCLSEPPYSKWKRYKAYDSHVDICIESQGYHTNEYNHRKWKAVS